MADGSGGGNPDRSSMEIKTLLRKLNPSASTHKDRVRRLERFRNYVSGGGQKGKITTPEFYDDDIPLLMLGSQMSSRSNQHALYENEYEDGDTSQYYGLIQSCGAPSTEHLDSLKRSAKNAMALLRFLVVDYVEVVDGRTVPPKVDPATEEEELNVFAHALCTCTEENLRAMKLHLHIMEDRTSDGKRSGGKEDACKVLVLLLTRHLAPDGVTPEPLPLQGLLPTSNSRKAFDAWLQTAGKDVQRRIKRMQSVAASRNSAGGGGDPASAAGAGGDGGNRDPGSPMAGRADDGDGGFNPFDKRSPSGEDARAGGAAVDAGGAPTQWSQSQLASADAIRFRTNAHRARDEDAELEEGGGGGQRREKLRTDEERKKMIGRDPLGLRGEDFDLRVVQGKVDVLAQGLLEDFNDESPGGVGADHSGAAGGGVAKVISREARKASLLALLKKGEDGAKDAQQRSEEDGDEKKDEVEVIKPEGSIVTTDSNFDPLLFLTVVHGGSTFDQLQDGLERLNNKTDNQVFRLQNLVRDNFGLFMRCADGVDLFEDQGGDTSLEVVKGRLDKLDRLSDSCVHQAKKSFTSLLDNTTEVRKTQSALTVLHRISPLLQAPTLMRQHLEAGRFTAAVKAYRRVLLIDDDCRVEILRNVKAKAAEAAREAQRDLEKTLADPSVPVSTLLDSIRDLGELNELHVPPGGGATNNPSSKLAVESALDERTLEIVRGHHPALACLLVQSSHFSSLVDRGVEKAENSVTRITMKGVGNESDDQSQTNSRSFDSDRHSFDAESKASGSDRQQSKAANEEKNRWRYDVLEARVAATVHTVGVARTWLPRLVRIGVAAREAERREAELIARRRAPYKMPSAGEIRKTAFEVYAGNVAPAVSHLVEHATFCALGCTNRADGDLPMTFGQSSDERVQALLRAPLPPALSAKCATELADLVDIVFTFATSAATLRPNEGDAGNMPFSQKSFEQINLSSGDPLETCVAMAEDAVIIAEKRRCIYAFDACGRTCSMRASSSGVFDGEALLLCVQKLSEELTRPLDCASEIERGCQLVIRRCCEGLATYVRERGVGARLRAVAECANALSGRMLDVIQDVAYLTGGQCEAVEELFSDDIESLEASLFDEFLAGVRRNVTSCVKLGWLDNGTTEPDIKRKSSSRDDKSSVAKPARFPSYLSAALLSIVRCRAQVEKALGVNVRRSQDVMYQVIAIATAADSLVYGMCDEINNRMRRIGPSQADRLASELQFVTNTLRIHLSHQALGAADNCRDGLCAKTGRGVDGGPDGLGAVEELERLGRVYVLCLGEI